MSSTFPAPNVAPTGASDGANDSYGILSSIRMVKEMVEKEFSQHGDGNKRNDQHKEQQQPPDGPTDTMSQIYRLKQHHHEEMKQWKDQVREQKDEIRRLEQRLEDSKYEAKTERELRTTLETTLEAQAAHSNTLESQLEASKMARSELEDHVKNLLVTFKEQTESISKERSSSENLIKELQTQKRDADLRAGVEEAGRLRAEAQRDELKNKVETLQKQLAAEKLKVQQLQNERGRDMNQSSSSTSNGGSTGDSSSSGLTWTAALKALEILKKDKTDLKAELERVKSKQRQKIEELEKSKKELQYNLEQYKSSVTKQTIGDPALGSAPLSKPTATGLSALSSSADASSKQQTQQTPSFETAISKASTLVASLQSSVDEIETVVGGKRPSTLTAAGVGGAGAGAGKKEAKKQKLVTN
jgi:DNA repair exonuclease SbcCD ATPase subunit